MSPGNCGEAPPSYSFVPYQLTSIRTASKSKIKQYYLAYTLIKLALDTLCIAGFDPSLGAGVTTFWAPVQILVDLILVTSALSCNIPMLKFVEVFAYIFYFLYVIIIAFLPLGILFLYDRIDPLVKSLVEHKDQFPPGMAIGVSDIWHMIRQDLTKMWIRYEISYVVSAICE